VGAWLYTAAELWLVTVHPREPTPEATRAPLEHGKASQPAESPRSHAASPRQCAVKTDKTPPRTPRVTSVSTVHEHVPVLIQRDLLASLKLALLTGLCYRPAGRALQHKALTAPPPPQQVALLPLAAPAHLMAPTDGEEQDCLPLRLLTPAQVERDEKTRDVYHFLTVQADVAVPRRHLR
jgi:hypothetical protein